MVSGGRVRRMKYEDVWRACVEMIADLVDILISGDEYRLVGYQFNCLESIYYNHNWIKCVNTE